MNLQQSDWFIVPTRRHRRSTHRQDNSHTLDDWRKLFVRQTRTVYVVGKGSQAVVSRFDKCVTQLIGEITSLSESWPVGKFGCQRVDWLPLDHCNALCKLKVTVAFLLTLPSESGSVDTPSCPFYRAMHYSAKRGLAIACHLSVCLWRWWIRTT